MIWAIFYAWGLEPQITQIAQMTQIGEIYLKGIGISTISRGPEASA